MRRLSELTRKSIKRAGALAWRRLAADQDQSRVVGLCYHSVHPDKSFASATPELFERHLAWLRETCDVIPLRTMLDVARKTSRHRPAVAITFDDGYADNYEFAFPLLRKYDMPATFFITAGLIDGDPEVRARFRRLRGTTNSEIRAMEWSQIRELLAAGLEIGGHTYSHPNLAKLSRNQAARELRVSKEIIEERVEETVDLFAYPFGKPGRHFDRVTIDVVASAGYGFAAAVLFRAVRPVDLPFALPRFFTTRDTVTDLASKIRGDWDYLGLWQERAPRVLARIVSPGDFSA